MAISKRILPIIVIAQFCCTSLWFAGNGVMDELIRDFNLHFGALGHLTSAVQFGFISGTLVFAIFTVADRFSPSKVFFWCAIMGAISNLGIIWEGNTLTSILVLRFFTGIFLAGIYPVGMKIAADYYDKGLGKSLGFLVGALVVGTAFPHLAKDLTNSLPWKYVLVITSTLAVLGGSLILFFVPDGPYRKPGTQFNYSAFFDVFKNPNFRSSAFGYFGHMWELYAFWAFIPVILKTYAEAHEADNFNIPLLSFFIIGLGGIACVIGGFIAQRAGTKRVASLALTLSCACCLLSPLFLSYESDGLFIGFLVFWGLVVIADSPLFSTLVAQNASSEIKGTALTIVNSIGFSISIISIQILNLLQGTLHPNFIYLILAVGPILGLLALYQRKKEGHTPS